MKQQQAALQKSLQVVDKVESMSNEMPCTELNTTSDIDETVDERMWKNGR